MKVQIISKDDKKIMQIGKHNTLYCGTNTTFKTFDGMLVISTNDIEIAAITIYGSEFYSDCNIDGIPNLTITT